MQNFTNPNQKTSYFLSQVHQPFFLFGIINAVLYMIAFAISYKLMFSGSNLLMDTPKHFHSYSMMYAVISQFFVGFLFTTFPRFLQAEVISKKYYMSTFWLFQVGSLTYLLGAFLNSHLMSFGMLILFIAQISFVYKLFEIYKNSTFTQKDDMFWMLLANFIGIATHIIIIAQTFLDFSVHPYFIAFYLYIVFLTFSVGSRMVPFFSHSMVGKSKNFMKIVFSLLALKVLIHLIAVPYIESLVDIALATFIILEYKKWKIDFKNAPIILKILHIAMLWVPFGLVIGTLASLSEDYFDIYLNYTQIHLLVLGFVITMLIGFGTRVTLGHSGRPPHADATTTKIFYLTQLVVLARFVFGIGFGLNSSLFWLFDISITLWILLFVFWSVKFAPILTQIKQ